MGSGVTSATHVSYTERFEEVFPYYLSLGMTYEQFWYKDPRLVRYYKEAEEIRQQRVNFEGWLQGLYTYQAIGSFVEILPAFPKKGARVRPYTDRPIPITAKEREEHERAEAIAKQKKMKARMEQFMNQFNRRFIDERNENRCDNARDKRILKQSVQRFRKTGGFARETKNVKPGHTECGIPIKRIEKCYRWNTGFGSS